MSERRTYICDKCRRESDETWGNLVARDGRWSVSCLTRANGQPLGVNDHLCHICVREIVARSADPGLPI